MAKGIINILTDKIFPAAAPDNQTKNSNLKALLFSPPITKGEADAALNHITGKFVERQTAASQTEAVKNSDDETQKTIVDFYKEVLAQQPFDAKNLAKKKLSVVLEAKKPAEQMTLADYEMAKNRAIFKQAGYSMLTDEEIQMAVSGIKANGSVNNYNFKLDNLRRIDKQPGAMFIKINEATIEYAKRAGQAVLQYQEYKAGQFDANQEKARSETNQMLLDPLRLGGNVPFRWAERTLNTPRDILQQIDRGAILTAVMPGVSAGTSLGGKISEQITGEPAPQMPQMPTMSETAESLTGVKLPSIPEIELPRPFEYQTEKYKREANIGEDLGATAIDLFLLKRGVIGKPTAAPETLESLGALSKETTATQAIKNVESSKPITKSMSNIEVRQWYLDKVSKISELNREWIKQGLSLKERAYKAWEVRHNARVESRKMMTDPVEVQDLRDRDIELYKTPDGPTFDWTVQDAAKKGFKGDEIYESIIKGSQKTNKEVNKKLGF
jgi:hypothetical protein